MSNININGSIGYTLLTNGKNNILILADMHSELPYCNNGGIFVSDWLKGKKQSTILLEEVPRENNQLKELWPTSIHTQKLKELYLSNNISINGIDVRHFLIPYSWEIINEAKVEDMPLIKYLHLINNFFRIKHEYFIKKLGHIYSKEYLSNSELGRHFLRLKHKVKSFIRENKNLLEKPISLLSKSSIHVLEKINEFISDIMEWFIIAEIIQNNNSNIIVHAGLAHTSNLNDLLKNFYSYKLISYDGINNISEGYKNSNGCLNLSSKINNMFGGKIFN